MAETNRVTRRKRGEPRALLLKAADELFSERGYDASTREIAERAQVSETLMFRYFGSKAGLFHAAMVTPFVEFVDHYVANATPNADSSDDDDLYPVTLRFVSDFYDLFTEHRGLVAMLWSSQAHQDSDLAEGDMFADVWTALDKLVALGARARTGRPARNEIATRAILSMIAGMAIANSSFRDRKVPPRSAVVEELAKIAFYGRSVAPVRADGVGAR